MSNRRELRDARRKAKEAVDMLAAIEALPRRRGQRVTWPNGVIWERVGDDAWEALHPDGTRSTDTGMGGLYRSAHVAWGLGL